MLRQCANLLPVPRHSRAITTTCLRRSSDNVSTTSPSFLGTAWESHKLAACLHAFDPSRMEAGLVRGAAVVSVLSSTALLACSLDRFTKFYQLSKRHAYRCGLTIRLSSCKEGHTSCGKMKGLRLCSLSKRQAVPKPQQSSKRLLPGAMQHGCLLQHISH